MLYSITSLAPVRSPNCIEQLKNQPATDNPWLNETARHPFNVFNDFNHESLATQRYMDRVLRYWVENFHIDGYRFDLSKGFTQNYTTNNTDMSRYDPSRWPFWIVWQMYYGSPILT
ncbi:MAG: hypothetical protein H6570_01965 [Lewinellaceae bacterium]|nr:hypothetical protein [Lewinellaceae bacterium]